MRSISIVALCHLFTLPTNAYVSSRPLSLARSAFVGLAPRSQPSSPISRPIIRAQRHVLFSSTTNLTANNAPSSSPRALGTSGDWSAYLDESKGLIYFFNPLTGESKWEPPEDTDFSGIQTEIGAAKKVEMRARLQNYLEERLNYSAEEFIDTMQQDRENMERKREEAGNTLKTKQQGREEIERMRAMKKSKLELAKKEVSLKNNSINKDIVSEWGSWQALVDKKRGQIYYYNKQTRESSWDKPDEFPSFKLSASKRLALEERSRRYREWQNDAAKVSVLGRGTMVVSDTNYEAGSSDGVKATTIKKTSDPAPQTANKGSIEGGDGGKTSGGAAGVKSKLDVNSQAPTLPIVQQGDWSAYFDIKTGVVFYFNEETRETSWDPPNPNFPRIVMENTIPTVLEPGSGNISMERALGYIGVDEMAEALAWEEAKKKERARKATMRAKEAEVKEETTASTKSETDAVEMYEAAKEAELERIDEERQMKIVEEQKATAEAASKLEEYTKERERLERIVAEEAAATEREVAAKLAAQEQLEQERLQIERLKQELIVAEEAAAAEREATLKILAAQEKLNQERLGKEGREKAQIAAEQAAAKEREAAANLGTDERLKQEEHENERPEKARLEAEKARQTLGKVQQPVLPDEDPTFTAKSLETMVAPLKTNSFYDVLQCSTTASRKELKRAYLSIAKETHPDALLQNGIVNDAKSERRFGEISQAWKILGDPTSRRRYDRELQAKGISSKAGNIFENWVMGAAKAMDEALTKAEDDVESVEGN